MLAVCGHFCILLPLFSFFFICISSVFYSTFFSHFFLFLEGIILFFPLQRVFNLFFFFFFLFFFPLFIFPLFSLIFFLNFFFVLFLPDFLHTVQCTIMQLLIFTDVQRCGLHANHSDTVRPIYVRDHIVGLFIVMQFTVRLVYSYAVARKTIYTFIFTTM